MTDYENELKLYRECLYEIKRRVEVIDDHIKGITTESYIIIEVETLCLQFRKILENIALLSLVANKDLYAENNRKFARHYHAKRIIRELERINPDFYPVPTKRIINENGMYEWINIDNGYLTKEDFVNIYEICGGMLHAKNPFSSEKPVREIQKSFLDWLMKITILLNEHHIKLVGGDVLFVGQMAVKGSEFPSAYIFELVN
ncbi:hypothetical protein [Parvimonas micra]|uniref:hypothetical protein n=1 Tax=Parvimonas micra TaxID=33033 RepID=UPI0022B61A0B|nr:hypothetical protein [Parvimonas micra]WBB29143.1 hypothetical protein NM223_05730 [Parvimonas micra]